MKTQSERILARLKDNQPHSRIELMTDLGEPIIDVPTRIFELKEQGFDIKAEMKPLREGGRAVAWYKLRQVEPIQMEMVV